MCKAVIDKGSTYLFCNTGSGIDRSKSMGFLINHENIIDLVSSLSISEFYVQKEDGIVQISYQEAMELYAKIIECQNTTSKSK